MAKSPDMKGAWPHSEPPVSLDADNTGQCNILEEPADRAKRELQQAIKKLIDTCHTLQSREYARRIAVLLVEDEPGMQRVFKRVLQSSFARVDVATTYAEALLRLQRNAYDVIIADHELPGEGTGADVIRWMRDQNGVHGAIPAILISGYLKDEVETKHATAACGADLYLQKASFSNVELVAHVQRLLGV